MYITKGRGALAVASKVLNVQSVPRASRVRRETVPPELPKGSGDAALASPAIVPEFAKCPNLAFGTEKTIRFCLLNVSCDMCKKLN